MYWIISAGKIKYLLIRNVFVGQDFFEIFRLLNRIRNVCSDTNLKCLNLSLLRNVCARNLLKCVHLVLFNISTLELMILYSSGLEIFTPLPFGKQYFCFSSELAEMCAPGYNFKCLHQKLFVIINLKCV